MTTGSGRPGAAGAASHPIRARSVVFFAPAHYLYARRRRSRAPRVEDGMRIIAPIALAALLAACGTGRRAPSAPSGGIGPAVHPIHLLRAADPGVRGAARRAGGRHGPVRRRDGHTSLGPRHGRMPGPAHAVEAPWFVRHEPITPGGWRYAKYGPPRPSAGGAGAGGGISRRAAVRGARGRGGSVRPVRAPARPVRVPAVPAVPPRAPCPRLTHVPFTGSAA